jgi:hypothetical protein
MNRRSFLQMLGLGVPAIVVMPDLARRYFLAPKMGWPYTFANGVYSVKDGGRIALSGELDSLEVEYEDNPLYIYGLNGAAYDLHPSFSTGKFRAVRGGVTLRGVFRDKDYVGIKQYLERAIDKPLAELYHERDPERKVFVTEYSHTSERRHG